MSHSALSYRLRGPVALSIADTNGADLANSLADLSRQYTKAYEALVDCNNKFGYCYSVWIKLEAVETQLEDLWEVFERLRQRKQSIVAGRGRMSPAEEARINSTHRKIDDLTELERQLYARIEQSEQLFLECRTGADLERDITLVDYCDSLTNRVGQIENRLAPYYTDVKALIKAAAEGNTSVRRQFSDTYLTYAKDVLAFCTKVARSSKQTLNQHVDRAHCPLLTVTLLRQTNPPKARKPSLRERRARLDALRTRTSNLVDHVETLRYSLAKEIFPTTGNYRRALVYSHF